ncbi:MAG: exo-beta-N-acetylmuramidase NamZ domain-containing protein, partial [Bacteroidota bacterium]
MAFLSSIKNTLFLIILLSACGNSERKKSPEIVNHTEDIQISEAEVIVAANRTASYLPLLKGKKIGVVANQTSVIFKGTETPTYTHLVDSLLSLKVHIQKVFAPEHGFRGKADAGEHVKDGVDTRTGLRIISLYGKNRKPGKEQLEGLDLVLFDIQDVGVRFYTYIATLQL